MKVNKKLIRSITSVFIVLVMCVGMFSITAYAVDVEAPSEIIYTRTTSVRNEWFTTEYKYTYTNAGEMMPWEEVVTANYGIPPGTSYITIWDFFRIEGSYLKDILVPKGGVTTFSIYNLYLDIGIDYPTGFYYLRDVDHTTTYVEYMDGTYEYTGESVSITQSDGVYNIIFKFTPTKDVKFVELQLRRTDVVDPANVHSNIHIYSGVKSTVWTYPTISINQLSEEAGILEGVQDQLADQSGKIEELPDKIGDEFQGVLDSEKEQSKEEGNKFVDQVLDKLPDPSQGVLAALGELTAAVGYTGTEAVIPFPAIVIPGIDGLFDDVVIYDGSDFDLGACIDLIPDNILTVVRSLFTIAIVLFCVYELKDIISFIFTLNELHGTH